LADSCFACSSPAEGVAVGKGDIGARPLITACSRHIAGYDAVALGDSAKRFADVEVGLLPPGCAGWLPQGWLRPYDLAGVKKFDRRVTSLLRRQMVRTAAGIPVGQSVYVEASGVVLDSDGVGIIDGRASVSRKPTGIHTILVRRQTPERFELCSPLAAAPSTWRVAFLANAESKGCKRHHNHDYERDEEAGAEAHGNSARTVPSQSTVSGGDPRRRMACDLLSMSGSIRTGVAEAGVSPTQDESDRCSRGRM
jgi:hypothetical protein